LEPTSGHGRLLSRGEASPGEPDASQQVMHCVAVLLRDTLPAGTGCFPRSRKGWRLLLAEHEMHAVVEGGHEFLTPALILRVFPEDDM
jgi:hypothetical protein